MNPIVPHAPEEQIVTITYLNHRGEIADRQIIPYTFGLGTTEYYPSMQYLLEAYDLGKKAMRTFAMNNIINWRGSHATDTQERVKFAKLTSALPARLRALFSSGPIVR